MPARNRRRTKLKHKHKQKRGLALLIETERGEMVIGHNFIVLFLILLASAGFIFAGGGLPMTFMPKAMRENHGVPVIISPPKDKPLGQNTLQMQSFFGVTATPTPIPTAAPCDGPLSFNSLKRNELPFITNVM